MLFLFDIATGNELYNGSVTENGFRIDTANSHYLEIRVKKEILNETHDGLVEDTRFNGSATNGSTFTDPGIYTVTVRNPTTGDEPTTKVIYVGDDDLLKASVANGMTISEVQQYLDNGATVLSDGTLVQASVDEDDSIAAGEVDENAEAASQPENSSNKTKSKGLPIVPIVVGLLVIIAGIGVVLRLRKRKTREAEPEVTNESESVQEDGELQ